MARSLNENREIVLIAHNIRSAHNIGSLFRTAEGLGVSKLILSGYSPYPEKRHDRRLSYVVKRAERLIDKTALGAQSSIKWSHSDDLASDIGHLRELGFSIYALEQHNRSQPLIGMPSLNRLAIIVGNEVTGLDRKTIKLSDKIIEIPMLGQKESFNVSQAAAMALFYFRYCS